MSKSVLDLHLKDIYQADVLGKGSRQQAMGRLQTVINANASIRKEALDRIEALEQINNVRKGKDYVTRVTVQYLKEGLQ